MSKDNNHSGDPKGFKWLLKGLRKIPKSGRLIAFTLIVGAFIYSPLTQRVASGDPLLDFCLVLITALLIAYIIQLLVGPPPFDPSGHDDVLVYKEKLEEKGRKHSISITIAKGKSPKGYIEIVEIINGIPSLQFSSNIESSPELETLTDNLYFTINELPHKRGHVYDLHRFQVHMYLALLHKHCVSAAPFEGFLLTIPARTENVHRPLYSQVNPGPLDRVNRDRKEKLFNMGQNTVTDIITSDDATSPVNTYIDSIMTKWHDRFELCLKNEHQARIDLLEKLSIQYITTATVTPLNYEWLTTDDQQPWWTSPDAVSLVRPGPYDWLDDHKRKTICHMLAPPGLLKKKRKKTDHSEYLEFMKSRGIIVIGVGSIGSVALSAMERILHSGYTSSPSFVIMNGINAEYLNDRPFMIQTRGTTDEEDHPTMEWAPSGETRMGSVKILSSTIRISFDMNDSRSAIEQLRKNLMITVFPEFTIDHPASQTKWSGVDVSKKATSFLETQTTSPNSKDRGLAEMAVELAQDIHEHHPKRVIYKELYKTVWSGLKTYSPDRPHDLCLTSLVECNWFTMSEPTTDHDVYSWQPLSKSMALPTTGSSTSGPANLIYQADTNGQAGYVYTDHLIQLWSELSSGWPPVDIALDKDSHLKDNWYTTASWTMSEFENGSEAGVDWPQYGQTVDLPTTIPYIGLNDLDACLAQAPGTHTGYQFTSSSMIMCGIEQDLPETGNGYRITFKESSIHPGDSSTKRMKPRDITCNAKYPELKKQKGKAGGSWGRPTHYTPGISPQLN